MTDICGFSDPGPIASASLQQSSDLGFADGVFIGHARSLVKYSCAVKEQITKWMGHAHLVPEKSISHVVAANIKTLMGQAGLSQTALANKAGLSQKTISNYLNPDQRVESATGKPSSPKLEELDKIARALGTPAWQLVREMTEKQRRLYELIEKAYAERTKSPDFYVWPLPDAELLGRLEGLDKDDRLEVQGAIRNALSNLEAKRAKKVSGKSSRSGPGAGPRKAA